MCTSRQVSRIVGLNTTFCTHSEHVFYRYSIARRQHIPIHPYQAHVESMDMLTCYENRSNTCTELCTQECITAPAFRGIDAPKYTQKGYICASVSTLLLHCCAMDLHDMYWRTPFKRVHGIQSHGSRSLEQVLKHHKRSNSCHSLNIVFHETNIVNWGSKTPTFVI